jgi:hypothetical protein
MLHHKLVTKQTKPGGVLVEKVKQIFYLLFSIILFRILYLLFSIILFRILYYFHHILFL